METLIVSIFIVGFYVTESFGRAQPSALVYRHQELHVYDGNFKPELYQHLSVTTITTFSVVDRFDCVFKCVEEPNCYSLNMAAFPDSKRLYLCELLATDKYRATASDLQENSTFHHFSPLVS